MSELAFGEVVPVGPILDPGEATPLGNTLLDLYREAGDRAGHPDFISKAMRLQRSDATGLGPRNDGTILLGGQDWVVVSKALAAFDIIMGAGRPDKRIPDSINAFKGAAVYGRWHIDALHDQRLLVNLSERPIGLRVPYIWDPADYVKAEDARALDPRPEPALHHEIRYGPGEGVFIYNPEQPTLQVPHAGSEEPDKIFLRLIATQR